MRKKTNRRKKIILVIVFFLIIAISLGLGKKIEAQSGTSGNGQTFSYTPMEKIPGTDGSINNLPAYILAIYKFGMWGIGISALFMISLGGFMYITAAGNQAAAGTAKNIIRDALIGLVMALVAWIILNEINPALVSINIAIPAGSGGATGGGSNSSGGVTDQQRAQFQTECNQYCDNGGAQETNTNADTCKYNCMVAKSAQAQQASSANTANASNGGQVSGGNCTQINDACNNNASGVDPKLLKAIMSGGEGCNKSLSTDGYGSCGYSQAKPEIRAKCGISGTPQETCQKIQNDPQLDANCAAWLIKDNAKRCGMDVQGAASCYNSGKANNCANTTRNYCGRVQDTYNKL